MQNDKPQSPADVFLSAVQKCGCILEELESVPALTIRITPHGTFPVYDPANAKTVQEISGRLCEARRAAAEFGRALAAQAENPAPILELVRAVEKGSAKALFDAFQKREGQVRMACPQRAAPAYLQDSEDATAIAARQGNPWEPPPEGVRQALFWRVWRLPPWLKWPIIILTGVVLLLFTVFVALPDATKQNILDWIRQQL